MKMVNLFETLRSKLNELHKLEQSLKNFDINKSADRDRMLKIWKKIDKLYEEIPRLCRLCS